MVVIHKVVTRKVVIHKVVTLMVVIHKVVTRNVITLEVVISHNMIAKAVDSNYQTISFMEEFLNFKMLGIQDLIMIKTLIVDMPFIKAVSYLYASQSEIALVINPDY